MAGYTGNKPKAANQVLLDLIEMEDNFEFFQSAFAQITGGWSGSAVTALVVGNKGAFTRAKFRWKDADEIYIGGAVYHHAGTTDQMVFWDSEITFAFGSGGSNGLSDDLTASAWHYVYIDDSAVVTLALNELTAAEFLNDTTGPTYSASKHGWYNGSDRCIGAFLTDGSNNILEFFHDGDAVFFADEIEDRASTGISTDWSDEITLTVPVFVRKVNVWFLYTYVDVGTRGYWRTEGQTASTGHVIAYVDNGGANGVVNVDVICSSNLKIDVREPDAAANTLEAKTQGWYFPIGM